MFDWIDNLVCSLFLYGTAVAGIIICYAVSIKPGRLCASLMFYIFNTWDLYYQTEGVGFEKSTLPSTLTGENL